MIVAEKITKYYGARAAVQELSFSIQRGEVIGLLGLNGAGKTTTLRILGSLMLPTSGRVTVDGIDLVRQPELVRGRIGFLPEVPPLYLDMTVESYLRFVARIRGVGDRLAQSIDEALEGTDLREVRAQIIGTLSNGYQRRLGIAQAIIHRPSLILLDEPTSGLDPVQIVQVRQLIQRLKEQHTVIVSSHVLSEIHQTCDRILVLQSGRLVAEGTEADLAGRIAQRTSISVEVRGSQEALAAALARAREVTHHNIERFMDGITSATVELASDDREGLARTLVESGLGLRRFEHVQLELENIFLELTGSAKDARGQEMKP
jgi:ABC-2 type transport system ATP-binding protein